jgi:hypothetical protein
MYDKQKNYLHSNYSCNCPKALLRCLDSWVVPERYILVAFAPASSPDTTFEYIYYIHDNPKHIHPKSFQIDN